MNNNDFRDPLDQLMENHLAANGEDARIIVDDSLKESPNNYTVAIGPSDSTIVATADSISYEAKSTPEIDFGDNDLEEEIKREDEARAAERKAKIEAAAKLREENLNSGAMPPQVHNKDQQANEVQFQSDVLDKVTGMINRVIAKNKLFTGCIPGDIKMQVMGDLVELYYHYGDEYIAPEFEQKILDNWVRGEEDPVQQAASASDEVKPEEKPVEEPAAKIEINVPSGNDVVVNVDADSVKEMTNANVLEIVVNEVSEKELKSTSVVIENSQLEGIIEAYDSGINDVPVTLPASAYRCVMKSISWFDFIRLVSPTSGTKADDELRKWSVIYKHLKNSSIGKFKDFEDFLKHTKYQDRELLMWGLLVATADEEETLALTCANPKCRARITRKYRPREIVTLDPETIPSYYDRVHNAAPGAEAVEIHNEVSNMIKRYQLPDTKIIVDIKEPSAYDFINEKLKLLMDLYDRYSPDGGDISDLDPNDPRMVEFDYLTANALYIHAMSIPKNGKEYRYTNWEDIEKIITTAISTDDSAVLLKIIQQSRANISPVSFRIHDITCPACKRHEEFIPITDIGNSLLFQVSRRLDNTQIKLTEIAQK